MRGLVARYVASKTLVQWALWTPTVWIEVDDPQQFGLPLWGHGGSHPGRFARRDGSDPTMEKAFEDALDGIAAAEDNRGNRSDRAPLMGQQDHLIAEPELGIGCGLVELAQCGHLG